MLKINQSNKILKNNDMNLEANKEKAKKQQLIVKRQNKIANVKKHIKNKDKHFILSNQYLSILKRGEHNRKFNINSKRQSELYNIAKNLCKLRWLYALNANSDFNVTFKLTALGEYIMNTVKPHKAISKDKFSEYIMVSCVILPWVFLIGLGLVNPILGIIFGIGSPMVITAIAIHFENQYTLLDAPHSLTISIIKNVLFKKLNKRDYNYECVLLNKYKTSINHL